MTTIIGLIVPAAMSRSIRSARFGVKGIVIKQPLAATRKTRQTINSRIFFTALVIARWTINKKFADVRVAEWIAGEYRAFVTQVLDAAASWIIHNVQFSATIA